MERDERRKAEKNYSVGMSIFIIAFGIFWCISALRIGAVIMLPFGLAFVGMAIYRLVMMLKISKEERPKEPWQKNTPAGNAPRGYDSKTGNFCPYCGGKIEGNFTFCPNCGRRIG